MNSLRDQLRDIRDDFPEASGNLSEKEPDLELGAEATEVVTNNIEVPTSSPFYMSYAVYYDLDPSNRQAYPEGKQQYLNALLSQMEAGQIEWPSNISNREEALEPVPAQDIRQWFEDSGRQALEQQGYPNPDAYLAEILGEPLLPPPVPEPQNQEFPIIHNAKVNPGMIEDPDQGESQLNFLGSPSIQRDEDLRGRLQRKQAPKAISKAHPINRESQADFAGSKGMKRQEQQDIAPGLFINVRTGPGEDSPQATAEKAHKFDSSLGVYVNPDLGKAQTAEKAQQKANKKNKLSPFKVELTVPPGIAAWLRNKGDKTDSGFSVSAETSERVGKINFDWKALEQGRSFVKIDFKAKVEDRETGGLKDENGWLVFNLPPEAVIAAKRGEQQQIEAAIKECVVLNEGSRHVQSVYDSASGNMFYGLGPKNQPRLGVPFSAENLRKIAGSKQDGVVDYIDRKSREFKTMNMEREIRPMWDFDTFLLEQRVWGEAGKGRILRQLVWDEAFLQLWKQKIGDQKLAELSAEVLEDSSAPSMVEKRSRATDLADSGQTGLASRNAEKNRWDKSTEQLEAIGAADSGRSFWALVEDNFGTDYLGFLTSGKFAEYAKQAKISRPDAINLIAYKILEQAGRSSDYQEFREFVRKNSHDQTEFIKKSPIPASSFENEDQQTYANLIRRLYLFLAEPETAASKFAQRGIVKKADRKPLRRQALPADYKSGLSKPESGFEIIDRGDIDPRFGPAVVFAEMQKRVAEEVAAAGFREGEDPDILIGN